MVTCKLKIHQSKATGLYLATRLCDNAQKTGTKINNCPFHFQDVEERFVDNRVFNPLPSEALSRFHNKRWDWKAVCKYPLPLIEIVNVIRMLNKSVLLLVVKRLRVVFATGL